MKQLVVKCVVGATVLDLCEASDQSLTEKTAEVFKKEKDMKKGKDKQFTFKKLYCIAFCIVCSVYNLGYSI